MACYARAYLSHVGMTVAPETKNHLMPNFKDYLKTLDQVSMYRCFPQNATLELQRKWAGSMALIELYSHEYT